MANPWHAVGVGLALALLGGCRACDADHPTELFGREAALVRANTEAPDAPSSGLTGVERTGQNLSCSWELDTTMDWPSYLRWLEGRLGSEFRAGPVGPNRAAFTRQLPGDTVQLTLEAEATAHGTHVRVTFSGGPS